MIFLKIFYHYGERGAGISEGPWGGKDEHDSVQGLEGARIKGFEKSNEKMSGAINYIAFSRWRVIQVILKY